MTIATFKVLLVEDSKFLRMANEQALSRAGYLVSTAVDGEEALQVAKDNLPDIILLDMLLPKLSGPEVLKALKANPATVNIPVIVLTSLSQKNEEKLLRKARLPTSKNPRCTSTRVPITWQLQSPPCSTGSTTKKKWPFVCTH